MTAVQEALARAHEVVQVPMQRYATRVAAEVLEREAEKLDRKAARSNNTGTVRVAESEAALLREVVASMRAQS